MAGRPNARRAIALARVDAEIEGVVVEEGGVCGAKLTHKEGTCQRRAGASTDHEGFGKCRGHGGNSVVERARGAWLMGHAIGRSLGVTPWEALLGEVRRSAGEVAWLDWKVSTAENDDALAPGGELHYWDMKRERARSHLAKVSKLALDAGVAERLLAQVQHDATGIVDVLTRVLSDTRLGLSDDQHVVIRDILRREARVLQGQEVRAIEGESEG